MRRVLVRCLAVAVSCGAALAVGSAAAATTVPDDTEPTADSVASDPELEAALAVFEERMTAAGFENLGPLPELDMGDMGDASDTEVDPELYADCDPAVRDAMASLEELVDVSTVGTAPRAMADRFGPAAPPAETESAATTTDPLESMLGGSEEVMAIAYRLDEEQIAAVDDVIDLLGSPEFVECFELMMAAEADISDVSVPELTDLSIPDLSDLSIPDFSDLSIPDFSDLSIPDLSDLSIPDLSDLSIPDLSDLSIPDLSDLSIPELTDLSIPDFSELSVPELTDLSIPEFMPEFDVSGTSDLGVGDRSASFNFSMTTLFDLSVETVIVRSGDVLITVSRNSFGGREAPMDVDLVAEAQAIVDSL